MAKKGKAAAGPASPAKAKSRAKAPSVGPAAAAPDYGSADYWEGRYKRHREQKSASRPSSSSAVSRTTSKRSSSSSSSSSSIVEDKEEEEEDEGHEWYFTYDELAPLITPLLDGILSSERRGGGVGGPDVLEIGCGDRPLGFGIVEYLTSTGGDKKMKMKKKTKQQQQQSKTCAPDAASSQSALQPPLTVVCSDISESVIASLLSQQRQSAPPSSCSPSAASLTFSVQSAMSLPYTSSSVPLILDKGTLDAILSSPPPHGVANSLSVLREVVRVLLPGGSFVLVSHLNPLCGEGMEWCEDVLCKALKGDDDDDETTTTTTTTTTGRDKADWHVEANVGEEEEPDDEDEEEKQKGPCVYVITKLERGKKKATGKVTMEVLTH